MSRNSQNDFNFAHLYQHTMLVLACLHTGTNTSRWRNLPPNKRCLSLWRLMAQRSFYSILQVEPIASLDEIKLAFKKRALQVHPDKGGSKEAFHLVYEALETLADPLARKKYDHALASGKAGNIGPERQEPHTGKKKTKKAARKPGPSTAKKAHSCGRTESTPQDPQASQSKMSKQTKLLIRIRDLLKKLPRELRNDVFTKQFSQQQRLILEKWMVDTSYEDSEAPKVPVDKTSMQQMQLMQHGDDQNHHTFATTPEPTNVPTSAGCSGSLPIASSTSRKVPNTRARKLQRIRDKKKESSKRVRSMCGAVCKEPGYSTVACYRARIRFDSFEMYTGRCDLQTALEYLVILTSVKQKMMDITRNANSTTSASFEHRLQEALLSSSKGTDLNLRFVVLQAAGFLVGPGFLIRTPKVRSVEQLGRLRGLLEPFHKYAQIPGRRNLFWLYSPAHVQEAWEQFQSAVAQAWEIAGADSGPFLQKIRAIHSARAEERSRHLQAWEQQRMGMQDKNKHRPKRLREKSSTGHREHWERRQMVMEDKHEHRPKRFRVPLHQRIPQDILASNLLTLKQLLLKWDRLLKRKERTADDQRRRQDFRKEKADRKEQRRKDMLKERELQKEQRVRRETLRKRMKMDLTMDEILGHHSVKNGRAGGQAQHQGFRELNWKYTWHLKLDMWDYWPNPICCGYF